MKEFINAFLDDHPEHRKGVRDDPKFGLTLNTDAVHAMGKWAISKGYTTPAKVESLKKMMERSLNAGNN